MKAGYIITKFPIPNPDGSVLKLNTSAFLLLDEEYGPIIFDTGSPYDQVYFLNTLKVKFGIHPHDVKWVFYTHLHPDHIGLNVHFKNARFILSRDEFNYLKQVVDIVKAKGDLLAFLHLSSKDYRRTYDRHDEANLCMYISNLWTDRIDDLEMHFIEDNPELPRYIDVVPAFGHSIKHYGYIINREHMRFLVAGDAVSNRIVLSRNNMDFNDDVHMFTDEYFRTKNLLKNFNGVIIPGHDKPFFASTLKSIKNDCFDIDEIK